MRFLTPSLVLVLVLSATGEYQPLYYFITPFYSTKATAILRANGSGVIVGTLEFDQPDVYEPMTIRGYLRGLTPGYHGFHIHQFGDMSDGCTSAGLHVNPSTKTHGAQDDTVRHIGDLGNIRGDANGNAQLHFTDAVMTLRGRNSIIGRSVIVHALRDDLGRGGDEESLISGNAGARIACGTVGLAAEENPERAGRLRNLALNGLYQHSRAVLDALFGDCLNLEKLDIGYCSNLVDTHSIAWATT